MKNIHPQFPDHHQENGILNKLREIVFGMEDGMVSTLGAITGIAVGSGSHYTVILSGCVIIAVESISMGIGSYVSNKSESDVEKRKLKEEGVEIKRFLEEEKKELTDIYIKDGWPSEFAGEMAEVASKNEKLLLHEMAHHELGIIPDKIISNVGRGVAMFFSYIIGGSIALAPYFIFSNIKTALPFSICITLVGLFSLGVGTTRFSKRVWWRAGAEFLLLASIATVVGYVIGRVVENLAM
ncbi:VIT1/CCC1 transporter family protein [Patescibacteria group bacterium]|nr:VIT1/CCC1 transporter family protein [Patescibacteria group bacterium]